MAKTTLSVLLAGFGGQGILFAGKVLAYTGLFAGKQVSWLPSYGPQMRGGTANCTVVISDEEIGSPLVTRPDYLLVMNQPSFDKFEPEIAGGGALFADSSLIHTRSARTDVRASYVEATRLAVDAGLRGLANTVLLHRLIAQTGLLSLEKLQKALKACIPAGQEALLHNNLRALSLGV